MTVHSSPERGNRTDPPGGPGIGLAAPVRNARIALASVALGLAGALIWVMARALAGAGTPGAVDLTVLALFAVNVLWTSAAAGVALVGLTAPATARDAPAGWRPRSRTAVLVTLCGEPAQPVARALADLHAALAESGLIRTGPNCSANRGAVELFILSDTTGAEAIAAETAALRPLLSLPGLHYRRRAAPEGRKPGNISDWVARHGAGHDFMVVLDADSRLTPRRLRRLIHRMDSAPGTALVQSGIRLLPADSRFGALQRLSARLCGPGFGRGLAAWTGSEGNFWGHNAIIRVHAFAQAAARLPHLPGRAPLGGAILSHDFVEAAWLRRAGWAVEIDPETRGSFEDGPQDLAGFHRRDRRWCQGNLQHLRLILARGLHPVSRLHLASGIQSYLAAPVWLALVLTIALGRPQVDTVLPLAGGLALLLVPKAAGAWHWLRRCRSARRRRVVWRALGAEIGLSSLVAPLILLRQSAAVAAVLSGRDCGWRPAGGSAPRALLPRGLPEVLAGLALVLAVAPLVQQPAQLALLLPVVGPLLAAPVLVRWLDSPRRRRGPAAAPRADAALAAQPA